MISTDANELVELAGPIDVEGSLSGFRRWGDDLIDRWDGEVLLRAPRLDGVPVPLAVRPSGTVPRPLLNVTVAHEGQRGVANELARSLFVARPPEFEELLACDPLIARLDAAFPGIRAVLQPDPLTALVRAISAQQVNLQWAVAIRKRLAIGYGDRHEVAGAFVYSLDPTRLAAAPAEDLRALQLTTAKAKAVIACSRAEIEGRLDRRELDRRDDAEVRGRLTALPGIGRWSADWFLARTLGRPVVVAGDLGVRKAVGRAYLGGRLPSEPEVVELTRRWGAGAGIAQQLLLHALVEGALEGPLRGG